MTYSKLAARRTRHCTNGARADRVPAAMMALLKDIGYGMRQLIKSPGYAISTIASLALGIGATTAIFSVVYGVLLNPYPYRNANRIVHVELHLKNGRFAQLMVNHRQFEDVRHALAVEDA